MIAADRSVGSIAVEHPEATAVFERHGIDYCCSGNRLLADACGERGLDPDVVLEEIESERARREVRARRWDEASPDELIDHILTAFHAPLKEGLPRLESMARKVLEAHRDKEPIVLPQVLSTVVELRAELEDHMAKEEQILFPMIKQGRGAMAGAPISVMHHEHDSAGAALARLRELTGGFRVPAEACATWTALWHELATLEESMHQHIHLENNILFPRALAGAPAPHEG